MELLCFPIKLKWVLSNFLSLASVSNEKPIVGWALARMADRLLDIPSWRSTTMKACRKQPSLANGSFAMRQSGTGFSSFRCLRWELCSSLLCGVPYLMSVMSCCLQRVIRLTSYFCNPLAEGIKIEWNKQLLHKYKSEGALIIQLVCIVNSIASSLARIAEVPHAPLPPELPSIHPPIS